VLSTTYGSGAGTFGIPDYRGRATFGQDNMGGVAANRITAAVSFNGTILGQAGGDQNYQAHTHANTLTDPGHAHALPSNILYAQPAGELYGSGSPPVAPAASNTAPALTGITISNVNAGSGASGNVPPAIITQKIIYAGI
jgi:microcystin-dependent protein